MARREPASRTPERPDQPASARPLSREPIEPLELLDLEGAPTATPPSTEGFEVDLSQYYNIHTITLDPDGAYHGMSFGDRAAAMNIGGMKHPAKPWLEQGKTGLRIDGRGAHLYPNIFSVPAAAADQAASFAATLAASGAPQNEILATLTEAIGPSLAKSVALLIADTAGIGDVHDAVFLYLSNYKAYGGDSLSLDSTCGDYILVENVVLHGGRAACHYGLDMGKSPTGGTQIVEFRGCTTDTDLGPASLDRWGGMGYNTSTIYQDCDWSMADSVEHATYPHGEAVTKIPGTELVVSGHFFDNCRIHAVGAEGYRGVRRPHTSYYDPNLEPNGWADIQKKYHTSSWGTHWHENTLHYYRNCRVTGWGQPTSWRGGAGFNFSGSGGHVVLDRCVAIDGAGEKFPAFTALTEGRFFDVNGKAQVAAGRIDRAFQSFTLKNSVFSTQYRPWLFGNHPRPIVTAQNALEFTMEGCVVLGHGDIRLQDNDAVTVKGCNTPKLVEDVRKRFPSLAELPHPKHVSYPGGYHPDVRNDLAWTK